MGKIEVKMHMDPVIKVANWFSDISDRDGKYGAVEIGTNGDHRFVTPQDFFDTIEELDEHMESDTIGKTGYVMIFSDENILDLNGEQYFLGYTFVVKLGDACLEFVTKEEIDDIIEAFGERLTTLKLGTDKYYNIYELS